MRKKNNDIFSEIMSEIECIDSGEKKAEEAYNVLMDKKIRKSLSDANKQVLFNCIKEATEHKGLEEIVASWCFLGDCYYKGIGCRKSTKDAISAYRIVIDTQGDYAGEWKSWAASKLGNIYIDQKLYIEAKPYIHMSTSTKDYERLARHLWENGDERGALEDYKKAGDYGRSKAYAEAIKKCLSSHDKGIREKAVEFACEYFKSDEDVEKKQKEADCIMDFFYVELHNAEPKEKERLEKQFERFKRLLDDNSLKKKRENIIKKTWYENKNGIVGVALSGIVMVAVETVKKNK